MKPPAKLITLFLLALALGGKAYALLLPQDEIDILQGRIHDPTIYGGTNNIMGESVAAPFTVGIGSKGQIHCTGTLVARNVVLTAGHCVLDPSARLLGKEWTTENLRVYFLTHSRPGPNSPRVTPQPKLQEARVSKIVPHPTWALFAGRSRQSPRKAPIEPSLPTPPTIRDRMREVFKQNSTYFAYDLALIALHHDAPEEFQIASLNAQAKLPEIREECSYVITGYGVDSTMRLPQRSGLRMSKSAVVDPKNIHAGGIGFLITGAPSICHGDSGGPLLEVCPRRVTVLAAASHMDPIIGPGRCESEHAASSYAFVWSSLDWILEELHKFSREINL